MNKTNIKCPRCYSDKLYKFGLNKQANQKYQCKQCKRQFALSDGDGLPKMNYPKCPKCALKVHTCITPISITTVINAITKAAIT